MAHGWPMDGPWMAHIWPGHGWVWPIYGPIWAHKAPWPPRGHGHIGGHRWPMTPGGSWPHMGPLCPMTIYTGESVNAGHFVKQKKGQIFCSGCFSLVNRGFFEFSFAQMSSPTSQDENEYAFDARNEIWTKLQRSKHSKVVKKCRFGGLEACPRMPHEEVDSLYFSDACVKKSAKNKPAQTRTT